MNIIIPYEENLYDNEGAFIHPNGEIIFTYGAHERFARNYCNGKYFDELIDLQSKGYSEEHEKYKEECFQEYIKIHNLSWKSRKDIDIYNSTELTREQLELYKLWLEKYEFAKRNLFSDFMVYLLQFDKVETVMRRKITTTNPQPHIRFYNYYLMDWYIEEEPPMKFNENTGLFEWDEDNYWVIRNKGDREAELEINEIKANVLKRDRMLFFK